MQGSNLPGRQAGWKFGTMNINVLVLAVVYQGVAFPVLFKMMPKFGNSSIRRSG